MSFESQRVKQISSSPSMIISMRAKELANEGRDIVDMSLGEPDFDTPAHIVDAAAQAMRDGHTRYTAPQGTLALRQAIVGKFQRENGLAYSVAALNEGACKLWPGRPEPTLSRLGMQVMKKNFTLDISRARHYLDYDPKVSLWSALDEFCGWWKAQDIR